MASLIDGATLALTGATGTLGHALVAELARYRPRKVILISRSESRQALMKEQWPETPGGIWRYLLADVRDRPRLEDAFEGADLVIHAAALKRVDTCEREPLEATQVNVIGTINAALAARTVDAKRFVFVSTDKATAACTLYGASKYLAERVVVAMNSYRGDRQIRYSAVRYGNVLGSTGSAAQMFARAEGAVPITDPRMTRFWITPRDAARFVLQALARLKGGEVFVPRLGSTSVLTLAEAFAPGKPTEVVGLRSAEKTHEALISPDEAPWTVDLGDCYAILPTHTYWADGHYADCERMPEGWAYTSDTAERLTAEQLRRMAEVAEGAGILAPGRR